MRNRWIGTLALLGASATAFAQTPSDFNGPVGNNGFVSAAPPMAAGPYAPAAGGMPMPQYSGPVGPGLPPSPYANPNPLVPVSPYFIPHEMPGLPDSHKPVCTDRWWLTADYGFAWIRQERLNAPLLTTGQALDQRPGAIGQSGTTVLFGDAINFGTAPSGRLETGVFLCQDHYISLDFGALFVGPEHVSYSQLSGPTGNPILARPFFDTSANRPGAFIDALPGVAVGGALIEARSELYGGETNIRIHGGVSDRVHADALVGLRYLYLHETLTVQDQLAPVAPDTITFEGRFVNPPEYLADFDRFSTINRFYGGQIGGRLVWEGDWCTITTFGKLALGATDERVAINGATTAISPTGSQTAQGGVLALPSNIGNYKHVTVGVIPEAGFRLALNVTPHIQILGGYSFLLWNKVVRPGDQIDGSVNPGQVPSSAAFGQSSGPSRPIFTLSDNEYWVHSLNLGLGFHY